MAAATAATQGNTVRRAPLITLASGGGSKGERAAPLRHPGQRGRLERGERAGAAPLRQPHNEEGRAAPLRHGRAAAPHDRGKRAAQMTAGQRPLASGGGAKGERAAPLRHPGQRRRLEGGEPAGAAPRASGSGNLTTREDAPRRCATGERWHRHDKGKRAAPMTADHWRWGPSKARGRAASQRHHAQRQRREWGEGAARLRYHDQRR